MGASIEEQVRSRFAGKPDVDDDILTYVITCLEDETFEFGGEGEEIYDTLGMMLVRTPGLSPGHRAVAAWS